MRFAIFFLTVNAFGQLASMYRLSWQQENGGMVVTLGGPSIHAMAPVTGAAYSGDRVSEQVRTLADGTHVSTVAQNPQKLWRDSAGRVLSKQSLPGTDLQPVRGGEFILVEICDPVAGFTYVIDDGNKLVHRYALTAAAEVKMTKASGGARPYPQPAVESLGEKNIEGVIAQGTRYTTTIPLGLAGNDQPMVATSEQWFAPELHMDIEWTNSDPRFGESSMRWTNVSRSEPEASLFALPAGYEVVDEHDAITIVLAKQ
jgi:hypothetical protein